MSLAGLDFLQAWIEKNITDADRNGSRLHAMLLADACVAEAAAQGISQVDLDQEWATLDSIIYEAIRSDVDAMLEIWKTFARARERKLPSKKAFEIRQ